MFPRTILTTFFADNSLANVASRFDPKGLQTDGQTDLVEHVLALPFKISHDLFEAMLFGGRELAFEICLTALFSASSRTLFPSGPFHTLTKCSKSFIYRLVLS